MREVTPGVYVETRYVGGNVGLILTGGGAICVDVPMMPDDARHWLRHIRRVTEEPVLFLVQSDCDPERLASTHLLEAPIIAHDAAWTQMERIYAKEKEARRIKELLGHATTGSDWQVRMPDITFTERLVLVKGRREIHVLHGGGHSPATCMVHLPQERLIFTGDVVWNDVHPTMELAQTKEWLDALSRLRKMKVDTIVPGRGAVCDKEATYPLSDYIRDMRAKVRDSFQAGRSKSETSKAVIPELLDAFPYDKGERECIRKRIKGGSDRAYDECRNAARTKAKHRKRKRRRR